MNIMKVAICCKCRLLVIPEQGYLIQGVLKKIVGGDHNTIEANTLIGNQEDDNHTLFKEVEDVVYCKKCFMKLLDVENGK